VPEDERQPLAHLATDLLHHRVGVQTETDTRNRRTRPTRAARTPNPARGPARKPVRPGSLHKDGFIPSRVIRPISGPRLRAAPHDCRAGESSRGERAQLRASRIQRKSAGGTRVCKSPACPRRCRSGQHLRHDAGADVLPPSRTAKRSFFLQRDGGRSARRAAPRCRPEGPCPRRPADARVPVTSVVRK